MTEENALNEYFDWLLSKIKTDKQLKSFISSNNDVLLKMFNTEFFSLISRDEHREDDALGMKYNYISRHPESRNILEYRYLSVLEVLVALATRCDKDLMGVVGESRSGSWFMTFLDSMGLTNDPENVEYILSRFLNREYERNGEGSICIIHNDDVDMREKELWYQLNLYLSEMI